MWTIIWFFVYLIEIDKFWHFMKKIGNIQYLGTIFRIWQRCTILSKNNKQIFDQNAVKTWEQLSAWVTWCRMSTTKSNFFKNWATKWKASFCNKISERKLEIIVAPQQIEKFALHQKTLNVTRNPSLKCGDDLLSFKQASTHAYYNLTKFHQNQRLRFG